MKEVPISEVGSELFSLEPLAGEQNVCAPRMLPKGADVVGI